MLEKKPLTISLDKTKCLSLCLMIYIQSEWKLHSNQREREKTKKKSITKENTHCGEISFDIRRANEKRAKM